jgi:hypothetical protein
MEIAMNQTAAQRDSFILRVWREGEDQAWMGWVQHARSGESSVFRSPADLMTFIERHTNNPNLSVKQSAQKKHSGLK